MRRRLLLVLGLAALIGCGGGGASGGGSGSTGSTPPIGDTGGTGSPPASYPSFIESDSPTLDDGGHYTSIGFTAKASGSATVTLSASSFDPILIVERVDGDGTHEVVAEDDDGGGSQNSQVTVPVTAGTRYEAIATAVSDDASGDLTLGYSSDLLTPEDGGKARRNVKLVPLSTSRATKAKGSVR